ncbi:MAG: hypothetical protein AB1586_01390 [Pseudomonadota bacterium]
MPTSPISVDLTIADRTLVAPGGVITVAAWFSIHQALGGTAFNVQLFNVASNEQIGGWTQAVGTEQLTAGATVMVYHSFPIASTAPLGATKVVLTANTADSNWTLLFDDPNAFAFDVAPQPMAAGVTTTSALTVAPGSTVTVTTSVTLTQALGSTAFNIQLFNVASNEQIGGYTQAVDASQLGAGAVVPLSHTFTIPANAPTGPTRVALTANTADANWTPLFQLPNARTIAVQGSAPSLFPAMAGAFVNWGTNGRESNMAIWESWLNQTPSSVRAMDFYGWSAWSDYAANDWLPGFWHNVNPQRKLVWSIGLNVPGTPLADVATGLHDGAFLDIAQKIAAAQPDAIIRIGWEMNIAGTPSSAVGQTEDYIGAYRRVVGIFRGQSPAFTFDWCPAWGAQDGPADAAYPGDDVVDYIGLDVYDYTGSTSVQQRWMDNYLNAPFGLNWQQAFAAAHGKPMSYPEWGVGQAGDNPYFIQQMHDWFVVNASAIAYACYFDVNGAWPTRIDDGEFPQSQALFASLFHKP